MSLFVKKCQFLLIFSLELLGSPLVLPLLSVEGSGMVVGEWDSESMAKHFPLLFPQNLKK